MLQSFFPIEGSFYNKIQIIILGFPVQYFVDFSNTGNQAGRITRSPRLFFCFNWLAMNPVNGVNHLTHTVAMAVSTVSLWLASFLLAYSFPLLNNLLHASGTFWLYGVICMVGWLFIYRKLPETKGKSLEEIEHELIG